MNTRDSNLKVKDLSNARKGSSFFVKFVPLKDLKTSFLTIKNSKKILPILAVLVIFSSLFVTVRLLKERQDIRSRAADYGVTLAFSPESILLRPGEEASLDVVIDSNGLNITAVELTIDYDPARIEVTQVENSNFLPVVLSNPSTQGGVVSLIFGALPGQTREGIVSLARIRVRSLDIFGDTQLIINSSSRVTAKEIFENVVESHGSALISVLSPTPIPTVQSTTPTPLPPAGNQVENGSFELSLDHWMIGGVREGEGILSRDTGETAEGYSSARIDVVTPLTWLGAVQFHQRDSINLVQGDDYTLSFWAKASKERPIGMVLRASSSPWTRYNEMSQNITTDWEQYNISFTSSRTDPSATLEFSLGQYDSSVWLDGVTLTSGKVSYTTTTPTTIPLPTKLPSQIIYEAEEFKLRGAKVKTKHLGYTGSGYVDYRWYLYWDFIEWKVQVPTSGDYYLVFRYALWGINRPLRIEVNGKVIDKRLSFPVTGSWKRWKDTRIKTRLKKGDNIIRATAIGRSGANIDHLRVER